MKPLNLRQPDGIQAAFHGKTALVTGASRGIGAELVALLLEAGAKVWATARRPEDLAALKAQGAQPLALDVTDADRVSALARELGAGVGQAGLELLINNAGVYAEHRPFEELSLDALRRDFEVNALGPLRVTQALLPLLRASARLGRPARIGQITSRMGSIGDNSGGGSYAYRTSKAALNAWSRSLAVDMAKDLVVLLLHPGWVATEMGGREAPVLPRDSARGLLECLAGAGPEHSGRFFDFTGQELPW